MKKIFTLTCMALMAFGTMNAKLIFHESFDDPNGTVGDLNNGTSQEDMETGGFPFYEESRWYTYSGSSNYIQVVEGSLSWPGYQTNGVGNKVYLWSSGADDVRSFSTGAIKSGKAYLSAIINVAELATTTSGDYFLSLGDHANSYFLGRLYAKSVKDGDDLVGFKLGIAKNNESANYLRYTDVLEPGKDYLVVVEYEFVDGEKNDIVRLYVNPTKETTAATLECVQDTVNGGGSRQGASNQKDAGIYGIFGAFLRQGYDATAKTRSTPKVYVDEIKIATAWRDIWVEKPGDEQGLESVSKESRAKSQKVIRDGKVVIIRDGKEFNVLGTEL